MNTYYFWSTQLTRIHRSHTSRRPKQQSPQAHPITTRLRLIQSSPASGPSNHNPPYANPINTHLRPTGRGRILPGLPPPSRGLWPLRGGGVATGRGGTSCQAGNNSIQSGSQLAIRLFVGLEAYGPSVWWGQGAQ